MELSLGEMLDLPYRNKLYMYFNQEHFTINQKSHAHTYGVFPFSLSPPKKHTHSLYLGRGD